LVIRQFAFDGLEFFPDDGECTITPGPANADAGVAAVAIDCPDVRDIRDKATITVAGVAALPAAMVMTDVPPVGGEVRVGRSVWEIESALWRSEERRVGKECRARWVVYSSEIQIFEVWRESNTERYI